jgi:hypothetical protein
MKYLQKIKIEKESGVISVFILSAVLFFIFRGNDLSLHELSNIYISQPTIDGVNVGARVNLFYQIVFLSAVALPLFYIGFYKLKGKLHFSQKSIDVLSLTSVFGIFLIVAQILGINNTTSISFVIVLLGLQLFGSIASSKWKNSKLFFHPDFYTKNLVITVLFMSVVLFLFNSNRFVDKNSILIFFGLFFILNIKMIAIKKWTGWTSRKIYFTILPLVFIPVAIFVSVEIMFYYKTNFDSNLTPFVIFIVLFASLFVGGFIVQKLKKRPYTNELLFRRYYVPAALLSFLLLTLYAPFINHSSDPFEYANFANAQMRMFHFGEVPFIDFMSSHMFSEQFYGIIYHLIHGYNGSLDFMVYQFMYEVLFYIVAYIFLVKLLKNAYVVLVILLLFPFINHLFCIPIFFSILGFFSIQKVFKEGSTKNYFMFFLVLSMLVAWRLDTGSAAIMVSLIFFPLAAFANRIRIDFKPLLKGGLIFAALVVVVFGIFIMLRSSDYLFSNLDKALHYITANQAHGRTEIAAKLNHQFYLIHLFIPLVSAGMILVSVVRLRTAKEKLNQFQLYSLNASVFLILIYIINFQRGLVRHSFIERTDGFLLSTFFIAVCLFILSYTINTKTIWRGIYLSASAFILILFVKYFPINTDSFANRYLSNNSFQGMNDYIQDEDFEGRNMGKEKFADSTFVELKTFFDDRLTTEQTFLDFSNSPMLYFYCERNVPSYFCQSQQNMVDDFLQLEQIKAADIDKAPYVIYSSYPYIWFDKTDGIWNNLRYYILAEHIYVNYRPFGLVNGKSIWIDKNLKEDNSQFEQDTLINQVFDLKYGLSADIIANYFKNEGVDDVLLLDRSFTVEKEEYAHMISIDEGLKEKKGIYLNLTFEEELLTEFIEVELLDSQEVKLGSYRFETRAGEKSYMMMLSNTYHWHTRPIQFLKIHSWRELSIDFYQDKRIEY